MSWRGPRESCSHSEDPTAPKLLQICQSAHRGVQWRGRPWGGSTNPSLLTLSPSLPPLPLSLPLSFLPTLSLSPLSLPLPPSLLSFPFPYHYLSPLPTSLSPSILLILCPPLLLYHSLPPFLSLLLLLSSSPSLSKMATLERKGPHISLPHTDTDNEIITCSSSGTTH